MNNCFRWLIVSCLSAIAALPLCASAQDASSNDPCKCAGTQIAHTAVNLAGGWQPETADGKTHAQVYQELVHAERDGHIAYLDRTIYAHH
jgi:Domain of unknown function (DUF4148)